MIRKASVAGMFYPGDRQTLQSDLDRLIRVSDTLKNVMGLVAPHAGYVYSGSCAGRGFGLINIPDSVIIIGVNHRGSGEPFAVDGHDSWNTPLGDCPLDEALRSKLVEKSDVFNVDNRASLEEHSLEVQVPFIQALNPRARILPVTVASMDLEKLLQAGREIGQLLKEHPSVLMVASTDMSHYIDAETADVEDQKAIEKITGLDPEGLFEVVMERRISMCGVSPTVIMLKAALKAGATKTEIVEYTHSGKVSGDYDQVVAYLSMIVY